MPSLSSTPKSHKSTTPKRGPPIEVAKPAKVEPAEVLAPVASPATVKAASDTWVKEREAAKRKANEARSATQKGKPKAQAKVDADPRGASRDAPRVEPVIKPAPRPDAGKTSKALAEQAGVSQATVERVQRLEREAPEKFEAVAEVAPVSPALPPAVGAVPIIEELPIASIRLDGGTQSRAALSTTTIGEYSEAMTAGATFPPVVVFYDGKHRFLADGFHRVSATLKNGQSRIECDVRQGSQRDAILYSVSANATHGLRRSTADKRHAVSLLLRDAKFSKKSNRTIGDLCGVDHKTVAKRREEMSGGEIPQLATTTREGRDGKQQPASKPKAKPKPANAKETDTIAVPRDTLAELAQALTEVAKCSAKAVTETDRGQIAACFVELQKGLAGLTAVPRVASVLTIATAPADAAGPAPDPRSAYLKLQNDLESHMLSWPLDPDRFVSTLESWTRRARDHFHMKEASNA